MKKVLFLSLMLFLCHFFLNAQPCLPAGITFSSQQQIDNFQTNYPNCTEIGGDMIIEGNDITNLDGLSVLTTIGGFL